MGAYEEKMNRVKAAIALEPVDKIPFLPITSSSVAAYSGITLKEWLADYELNCTASIKFMLDFECDGSQAPIFTPATLPLAWLSKVNVPGDGVGDNELWQVHEEERMTQEDYDRILEMGWGPWLVDYTVKNFGPGVFAEAQRFGEYYPIALKRFYEAGIPSFMDKLMASPIESVCGGRSLAAFLMDDLMDMPEKVEETFDAIHAANMKDYEAAFSGPGKPTGVWIGLWRGIPSMLSPEMFERFSWRYVREYVDLCVQYDVIPILHMDGCWDVGLKKILELPEKKCILGLDGATDIFLAKEVVGKHSCIMGDVPPQMSAFAAPEEVYDYSRKLIREIGPQGFILASGCDIPFNCKFENIAQMPKAIRDFHAGK